MKKHKQSKKIALAHYEKVVAFIILNTGSNEESKVFIIILKFVHIENLF